MEEIDQPLYILIRLVSQRMKKMADGVMQERAGLSTAQAAVLTIIASKGCISQSGVAQILAQQESAITTMSRRLEAAGYITKTRSEKDKRVWDLKPTESGLASLIKLKTELQGIGAWFDETLSPQEQDALRAGLNKLLAAFDDQSGDEK